MIVVKIMGGLGNQMFQYALGKAVARRNNTSLHLDISGYQNMHPDDTPRQYELGVYGIQPKIATTAILSKIQPENAPKSRIDVAANFFGFGKLWTVYEKGAGYNPFIESTPNNSYLVGWWQTEKYFSSIRDLLLEDFEPRTPLEPNNDIILEKIVSCEAVSIHVRRGDYINNPSASAHHGISPVDYYSNAIQYMSSRVKSVKFFVFSDDLEWCKQMLPLPKDSVFVSGNEGCMAYEDIRLMKNCKHNIIANSSFSWWGAWLNVNNDKIVIAPKQWFANKEANAETEIVPQEWIRL